MKIFNNTPSQVFYGISSSSSADCGNIDAGKTTDLPGYDNQTNVTVNISVNSGTPNPAPFSVTIPQSGVGQAVTIGLNFE